MNNEFKEGRFSDEIIEALKKDWDFSVMKNNTEIIFKFEGDTLLVRYDIFTKELVANMQSITHTNDIKEFNTQSMKLKIFYDFYKYLQLLDELGKLFDKHSYKKVQ